MKIRDILEKRYCYKLYTGNRMLVKTNEEVTKGDKVYCNFDINNLLFTNTPCKGFEIASNCEFNLDSEGDGLVELIIT